MPPRPLVTMHAMRRYAERVLGEKGLPRDDQAALVELRARGLELAEIKAAIADAVRRGVESGATAVKRGRVRYVLDGVTIKTVVRIRAPAGRVWARPRIERHFD